MPIFELIMADAPVVKVKAGRPKRERMSKMKRKRPTGDRSRNQRATNPRRR
jgi:hypothetical protein